MTPLSFQITKFKVLSSDDGLVSTEYGNIAMGPESREIEFQEVLLEDLSVEQASEIKDSMTIFLNFDNYPIELALDKATALKTGEDTFETFLSSKEAVEAEVLEILDKSNLAQGSVLLRIKAIQNFGV